jgi:hypothetical protein
MKEPVSVTGKWRTTKTIDHMRVHPPSGGVLRVTHHYSDGSRPKEHTFSSRTALADHIMGMLPRSREHDGEPQQTDRQESIAQFEENPEEEA